MAKASGIEHICHKSVVFGRIIEQFNNPNISDVTLKVGEQVFSAHRFVLAAQSKVFHTMLLGKNWKESMEQKVTLEESSHGEAAFSGFLKFFYTGKLILTMENVCGIHTLADKYDVPILKEDCFGFMKNVLTGIHGDALGSAFEWMQYIETCVPDLLAACYSAIRANFNGLTVERARALKGKLTDDQLKNILIIPDASDDIVVGKEIDIFHPMKFLSSDKPSMLPFIRFYNMNTDELEALEKVPVKPLKDYFGYAYKVQAEQGNIYRKACKKQRLSDGNAKLQCPCDENTTCPHINPRFYLNPPFGVCCKISSNLPVEPIDLSDLGGFIEKVMGPETRHNSKEWVITRRPRIQQCPLDQDPILYELYTVQPALCHVGRRFSLVLVLVEHEPYVHKYSIKCSGVVSKGNRGNETIQFDLKSPKRFKASWEIGARHAHGASILLHK